jgi:hypothetical protein
MKNLFIAFVGLIALLSSCIEDKGNYDYVAPEAPIVKIDSIYNVFVGDSLVIEPNISFSNKNLLSFKWAISDPDLMTSHEYGGDKLDILFTLQAKLYYALLTITESETGMKYFYPFHIQGKTAFDTGILLLTSNNGHGELSFIKPDGTIQKNLYENMHEEALPSGPLQIVPLQQQNYVGKPYLGYWLLFSDKNNPGVLIDPNALTRIKYFRDNFFSTQKGELSVGPFIRRDDATMSGIINNKFYVGAFETYYLSPVYGSFGSPVQGNYELAPVLAVAPDGTFVWSYDTNKRSLVCFIPPAKMFFDAASMPGPPPAFDPANIDLDLITLLPSNAGFYLFGRSSDGSIQELKFSTGGQNVISQYKRPFSRPDLIKEDTKWVLLPGLEVFYFTSGDKIYRYNPLNESVEALSTPFSSRVSLLKFVSSDEIIAGENGRLYRLNISVGHTGEIIQTINGFDGEPGDVLVRKND